MVLSRRLVLVILATGLGYLLAATTLHPRAAYEAMQPKPPEPVISRALTEVNLNPDDSPIVRLGRWARGIVTRRDLGRTIDNRSINEEVARRAGVTLRLLLIGAIAGSLSGVAIGAFSATRQYGWSDTVISMMSVIVLSTPVFVLGVALKQPAIAFNDAVGSSVLALQGEYDAGGGGWTLAAVGDRARHLVVPTATLAAGLAALFSRYQRTFMLDVLGSDFIIAARARGLRRRQALLRHGMRVAVVPMVTLSSYHFALLLSGAVLTEKILGWHGMGEFLVDSVNKNDVNALAAVTLFSAVLVLLTGVVSDVALAVLDPRVRSGRKQS